VKLKGKLKTKLKAKLKSEIANEMKTGWLLPFALGRRMTCYGVGMFARLRVFTLRVVVVKKNEMNICKWQDPKLMVELLNFHDIMDGFQRIPTFLEM